MGMEVVAAGLVAWLGGAFAAERVARAAGASGRRWFWLSLATGPVGWVGAYVVARDASERGGRRDAVTPSAGQDEEEKEPTSRTVRLPRSSAPFLQGKSHGGV